MSCSVWNDVQLQLLLMLSQSQGKTSNADRKKLFKELQLRSLAHFQDGVTTSVFFFRKIKAACFFLVFFFNKLGVTLRFDSLQLFWKFPDQQEQ